MRSFRIQAIFRSRADKYRRQHADWLSRHIDRPGGAPRIPVREVDTGGFERFKKTQGGRVLLKWWWADVFERTDD